MKTNKPKTLVKTDKKTTKQVVKKELEASITSKFMEALKSLGHDADKFSKDIKKTSKELAKKLSKKYIIANNTLKIELTDKLKSCCDGFTRTIENISTGDVCTDFVLPLDALRIILTNKVEKIKFRYHKQKPLVNLLYDIDGIHMSYVVPCINK